MLHTKEERRLTCIHEAAHAVIGSLIRHSIYTIAIAPEGDSPMDYVDRKGRRVENALGFCDIGGGNFWPVMELERFRDQTEGDDVEEWWYYGIARKLFRPELLRRYQDSKDRSSLYQEMRGHLCHIIAGYVSELIYKDEGDLFPFDCPGYDGEIAKAHAIACLLPFRHEFDWCHYVTAETLRQYWPWVSALAERLESQGILEFTDENDHLLPPYKENWPPPPPPRNLWNPSDNFDSETGRWLPPKPAPRGAAPGKS